MRDHERKSSRVDLYERETERDREFTSFFLFEKADEKRTERKAKDSSKDLREPEG
jgi:hypothetical protein